MNKRGRDILVKLTLVSFGLVVVNWRGREIAFSCAQIRHMHWLADENLVCLILCVVFVHS